MQCSLAHETQAYQSFLAHEALAGNVTSDSITTDHCNLSSCIRKPSTRRLVERAKNLLNRAEHEPNRHDLQRRAQSLFSRTLEISSANGKHTPLRLHGVNLLSPDYSASFPLSSCACRDAPIEDTGSSITLIGYGDYVRMQTLCPSAITRVTPLPSSTTSIAGVGSVNSVLFHVEFTLELGGLPVVFRDVPVLAGFAGVLLGNDLNSRGKGNAQISHEPYGSYDGFVIFRDDELNPITSPIPFTDRGNTAPPPPLGSRPASRPPSPTGASAYLVEDDTGDTSMSALPDDTRQHVESCVPIAFAPEATQVPAWSEKVIRCRVPAAALEGHTLAILPLEDSRIESLNVLVAPALVVPENGYVYIKVINTSTHPVNIPLLQPVARFIVDPTIGGRNLEFTLDEIMDQINVDSSCTDEDKQHIREMLSTRRRLFASVLGWAHGYKLHIHTPRIDSGEIQPPAFPARRRSPEETAALRETILKLMKNKLVEPACSPYNAMAIPIKKSTGGYRVVLDYRSLNQNTTRDSYPLPNIETHLFSIGKANLFTVCDLLMGFHQCELDEISKPKTAFNGGEFGQLQFTRMPMGLTSSPGAFMRLVDSALRGLPPGLALAYLDDIICASSGDMKSHMKDVGKVFDRLIEAGFTVRSDKVWIGLKEVPFLGVLIGGYGTRANPSKLQALFDMTYEHLKENPSAVARFTGMIAFYSKFIPNLHYFLAPFHDCKQTGADIKDHVFSLRFRAHFEHLRHMLASITSLTRPDPSQPYYLDVDSATTGGTGAVLQQRQDPNDPESLRPIAFWSRRFSKDEASLPIRDQEALGLGNALEEFRPLILGSRIVVRTDHRSLVWLRTTQHRDGSRIQGIATQLEEFDIKVEWVPGSTHIVPDFLSRDALPDKEKDMGKAPLQKAQDRYDKIMEASINPPSIKSGSGPHTDSPQQTTDALQCIREDALMCTTEESTSSFEPVSATSFTSSKEEERSTPHQCLVAAAAKFKHRNSPRIGFIAITANRRKQDKMPSIFVEQYNKDLSLPAFDIDVEHKDCYRTQLRRYLTACYGRSSALVSALANAVKLRPRSRHATGNHQPRTIYFVAILPQPDTTLKSAFCHSGWVTLSGELVESFTDNDDFAITTTIHRELDNRFQFDSWRPLSELRRCLSPLVPECTESLIAEASTEAVERVPSLADAPCGPAFCTTEEHFIQAMSMIYNRLKVYPELSVAIDLEGPLGGKRPQIDLIQIAIDAPHAPLKQLIYVFDTFTTRRLLQIRGPHSLRALLQNPSIVKVLHCCSGDANALWLQYSIPLKGVFDTGIADSVIMGHYSFNRGLQHCLRSHLEGVNLSLKDDFEHIERMFTERPFPYRLFRYAYEDVLHCNALYRAMRTTLLDRGLLELTFALSANRTPPICLKPVSALYQPPTSLAIALVDSTHVICLRHRRSGLFSLPVGSFTHTSSPDASAHTPKQQGRTLWASLMGAPPKPTNITVNSHLQKPVRLGHHLLLLGVLPKGTTTKDALPRFIEAAAATNLLQDFAIITHDVAGFCSSSGAAKEHCMLFQYLQTLVERRHSRLALNSSSVTYSDTTGQSSHSDITSTTLPRTPSGGQSSHSETTPVTTSSVLSADNNPELSDVTTESFVVVGPRLVENRHTSLILLDETHAYVMRVQPPPPPKSGSTKDTLPSSLFAFPSRPLEVGSSAIASAVRAFDELAGSALRRGGNYLEGEQALVLHPSTSSILYLIEAGASHIGDIPTCTHNSKGFIPVAKQEITSYFAFKFRGSSSFPSLVDHLAAFYSARQEVNGFRLLKTIKKKFSGFDVIPLSKLLTSGLSSADLRALEAAVTVSPQPNPSLSFLASPSRPPLPHSRASRSRPRGQKPFHTKTSPTTDEPLTQSLGNDKAYDALFEASVLLSFMSYLPQQPSDASCSEECSTTDEPLAFAFTSEAAGVGPMEGMPSRLEILEEQRKHPALSPLLDYLTLGPLANLPSDPSIRSALLAEAPLYLLASDGLLLYRGASTNLKARIVVPERFHSALFKAFHDRLGHFGISRVVPLILERFYWGSNNMMSRKISEYINRCPICARSKVPHHSSGQRHLVSNGEHPMDVVSMDAFKTGLTSDGYDGTLSFGCQFSRHISAAAMKGDPSSEEVANILLTTIIRVYGTPRAVRCDHASVFVSKALGALYSRFGIRIEASTAYHHRTVGLVERWHSTLRSILLSHRLASGDDRWYLYLPLLELAFNSSVNRVTGYSPFFIIHGRHPVLPQDVLSLPPKEDPLVDDLPAWVADHLERIFVTYDTVARKLQIDALNHKKSFDLKHDVVTSFKPGDRVLVLKGSVVDKNHPKAEEPYMGPFTVQRCLGQDRYQLTDLHTRRMFDTVHVDRLKRWPSVLPDESDGLHSVERIVGHRFSVGKDRDLDSPSPSPTLQYRVRWRGYSKSRDSWLSVPRLFDVYPLVERYNNSLKARKGADLEQEHSSLFESRDVHSTPLPSEDAKIRPHFRTTAPAAPSPDFQAPIDLSRMSLFEVGSQVKVFTTGFGGARWWNGVITRRLDSFDKKDCKLTIKFNDQRYRKPFVYKYSLYGLSIELLDADNSASQPHNSVSQPSSSAESPNIAEPPLSADPPALSSASPSVRIDAAGRRLRDRKSANYRE